MIVIDNLYFIWNVSHNAISNYKMEKIYLKNPHKVSHMYVHNYNRNSNQQNLFEEIEGNETYSFDLLFRGIEITVQLLELENIREASLIVRDRTRLTP